MIAHRLAAVCHLAWLTCAPVAGQQARDSALEAATQAMLTTRESRQAFDRAVAKAESLGAKPQAVLEARFLFLVDQRDDAALVDLLPQMEARAKSFRLEDSDIFAFEDDWLATLEYVRALSALERDDGKAFRQHVTQAFWLSPRQGAVLAPYIEDYRRDQIIQKIKLSPKAGFRDLNGSSSTLGKIRADAAGLVIHFFSPWSREAEAALPALRNLEKKLSEKDLPIIHVVADPSREATDDTIAFLEDLERPAPGLWFTDTNAPPISRRLRIQTTPTLVLLDSQGGILFAGHPADRGFLPALREIAPTIQGPLWKDDSR